MAEGVIPIKKRVRRPISPKLRFEILRRDKHTCQYCGRKAPDATLQVDHIHPVAHGGTNDPSNLTTACWECNIGKGARVEKRWPDGPIFQAFSDDAYYLPDGRHNQDYWDDVDAWVDEYEQLGLKVVM